MELNCFTHGVDRLIYNINPTLPAYVDASECDFSWSNRRAVVADNWEKDQLVMRSNTTFLETSKCFESIDWKAHCVSKIDGYLHEFVANCTTSCAKEDMTYGDKNGNSTLWIVIGIFFILFLAFLGGFIYKQCRAKNKNLSLGCSQCGGLYTSVKVDTTIPMPPDEE